MRFILTCVSCMSALLLSPVSYAETDTSADSRGIPSDKSPALSPVAAALSELKPISGSFNPQAEYFIYVYSASWCGPCRAVMPRIVRLYKDTLSKDKRIEIILIDLDHTEEAAKNYIAHYDADFFATMGRKSEVDHLPGAYQVRGIPHCIAVDKNGKRIFSGHAAVIFHNLGLLN